MKLDTCLVVCDVFTLEVLSIQQRTELYVFAGRSSQDQQSVFHKS